MILVSFFFFCTANKLISNLTHIVGYEEARDAVAKYVSTASSTVDAKVYQFD